VRTVDRRSSVNMLVLVFEAAEQVGSGVWALRSDDSIVACAPR
jgi:hypothetical protein